MFIGLEDSCKDNFVIREFDSKILELLIDFIYTGEIMVTKENVQVYLNYWFVMNLYQNYLSSY